LVIYLVEGLLFLLTGFQMRALMEKSKAFPFAEIMWATVLVTVVIIVARFVWVYAAIYVPRWLSADLRKRDPAPNWQWTFVVAFTGVRGAVSLAAALALPFTLVTNEGFPSRDLILFVSFNIILITLVGFGLCLPIVVKWLGVTKIGREEYIAEHEAELATRREALATALARLDAMTDDRELSDEVVKLLRARHESRSNQLPGELDPDVDVSAVGIDLVRELIKAERKFIHAQLRDGKITDESRRRIERDLDLEEAGLSNREFRRIPL
jgi:CPA1 family monovalent cation:H+ antiporter